ncbi:hypothetical protein AVEN_34146-1 [Araneus ventricosus]|uniref:Uncharacterized protein n=1 Tax=Araneus ventricosus TaxID=182803 RepID=A0A4Y2S7Q0_ARAVE|nr:hypothetical protein AVEN_34146-1 [Araneus ventricosus]
MATRSPALILDLLQQLSFTNLHGRALCVYFAENCTVTALKLSNGLVKVLDNHDILAMPSFLQQPEE